MLPDIERKTLRIIFNCSLYGRSPTIDELSRWTGRDGKSIYQVLYSLSNQRYIQWSEEEPENIRCLRS